MENSMPQTTRCHQHDYFVSKNRTPTTPSSKSKSTLATPNTSFFRKNKSIDRLAKRVKSVSPLEALALTCVLEKSKQEEGEELKPQQHHSSIKPTIPRMSCSPIKANYIRNYYARVGAPIFVKPSSIHDNDILCGRGGFTNNHRGNVFFRSLVRCKESSYAVAGKIGKNNIARSIVEQIHSLKPPGRFLKKKDKNLWVEIGNQKALEKTAQALRERAPEIREDMQKQGEHEQQMQSSSKLPLQNSSSETTETNGIDDRYKLNQVDLLALSPSPLPARFIHPVSPVDDTSNRNSPINFYSNVEHCSPLEITPLYFADYSRPVSNDCASQGIGTFLLPASSSMDDDVIKQNAWPCFIADMSVVRNTSTEAAGTIIKHTAPEDSPTDTSEEETTAIVPEE